jgi:murein DD-endopeptidase MepM/ murein hydrolase activator NlpD
MQTAFHRFSRGLFAVYLVVIHLILLYVVGERVLRNYTVIEPVPETSIRAPGSEHTPVPTPLPVPESFADAVNANVNSNTLTSPDSAGSTATGLLIPVVGVTPDQLIDTFSDSRSEERFHDAIDIPAPAGTPVVAATDGEIARFYDSEKGGITIYQFTADRKFILYYAHLQRRADEISVGTRVRRGATIGYVGDTGNAGAGNYHLHFSIARITDPKRYWEGAFLNPYPLLKNGTYPSDLP